MVAEELGIGIMTGSTFLLKEKVRDDVDNMCIPNALVKEVRGFVTHVSSKVTKIYFSFIILLLRLLLLRLIPLHRLKIVRNSGSVLEQNNGDLKLSKKI